MGKIDISLEMQQQLEDASAAWLERAIRALKESAENNGVVLTGESIKSISGAISNFSSDGVMEIAISFQNSARILDWRTKPQYTKNAPIEELVNWVLKKGVQNFKRVPGYGKGKPRITDSQAARRIAWGIAVSRFIHGPKKRKRWFAKVMYGPLLGRLMSAHMDILGTSSLRVITENFKIEE
jgi:hypothetical protein